MPTTAREHAVHVVAAVLFDGQGRVLISQRSDASHQGGKWEFPGGKVAAGESAFEALKRELYEELGIDVLAGRPFLCLEHAYPDRTVLLDVWRVTAYRGVPRGCEGQPLRWVGIEEFRATEFPEADRPILRRLQLPMLYAITDFQRYGRAEFLSKLERALRAGVRWFQLREPGMSMHDYERLAQEVLDLCRAYGAKLLLNASPEQAVRWGGDGVHLTSTRLMESTRRPLNEPYWVAASCHNEIELVHAQRLDVDFVVLGPVKRTTTHSHVAPMGWERLRRYCENHSVPIFALGGMRLDDIEPARTAGAQGVAMITGLWDLDDIAAAVTQTMRHIGSTERKTQS